MKKLQSAIRKCTGRIQNVHELDTSKMTYLKMVVKEALRLHIPGPLLVPRESLSHTQVDGYDVSPGTMVFINAWGIAREPSTWENAAEFYPERFEKHDVEYAAGNFELLPFGGGRRSCPEVHTAPASIEFVIANLFYWFDWQLPNGVKNEDLDMQEDGPPLVTFKKIRLSLIPIKHNWEEE